MGVWREGMGSVCVWKVIGCIPRMGLEKAWKLGVFVEVREVVGC